MEDWRRVWAEIEARSVGLGMQLEDLYAATHFSETSYRHMREKGQPIKSPAKRSRICIGLGWTPDSIDLILSGKAPIEATPKLDPVKQLASIERKLDQLAAMVEKRLDELSEVVLQAAELRAKR